MYDIIVDVDGVLLDVHAQLKKMFAEKNIYYDVNDVYTYDFNKKLPDIDKFRCLPPREMIYKFFQNPVLYKSAPVDWDSIMFIRKYAEKGVKFLIYTVSYNPDVFMVKQALFSQWFLFTPNVVFKNVSSENEKVGVDAKIVIEDSHINLRKYDAKVYKFLVNRPYNSLSYNYEYSDVFADHNFRRCPSTISALTDAAKMLEFIDSELAP